MSYTLSFDASVKVQRGAVAGLLHHIGREVDQKQGTEVRHANQDIDPSRTSDNCTMVSDGNGNWTLCSDLNEIQAALDARLADVKKPLRHDAVVLRPLILQLDPAWYAEHTDEKERHAAFAAMFNWAIDTFGSNDLIYVVQHKDETNPHLHIGFCPVTEDGRLSQKDWFPGPAALRKMHQDFREYMREREYAPDKKFDIDLKNRKPGKYAKRMGVQEYKDFKELEKLQAKVSEAQAEVEAQRAEAQAERDAAVADRTAAKGELAEAQVSREAVQGELAQAQTARAEAEKLLQEAKADREAAGELKAGAAADRTAAGAELTKAGAVRQEAEADREAARAAKANQEAQEAAAAADRAKAAQLVQEAGADRQAAAADRTAAKAELEQAGKVRQGADRAKQLWGVYSEQQRGSYDRWYTSKRHLILSREKRLQEREAAAQAREAELAEREAAVADKEAAMDAMARDRYRRQLAAQQRQRDERNRQRVQDGEALPGGLTVGPDEWQRKL